MLVEEEQWSPLRITRSPQLHPLDRLWNPEPTELRGFLLGRLAPVNYPPPSSHGSPYKTQHIGYRDLPRNLFGTLNLRQCTSPRLGVVLGKYLEAAWYFLALLERITEHFARNLKRACSLIAALDSGPLKVLKY